MKIRFDRNKDTLEKGLAKMLEGAAPVILKYAETKAKVIESEMKKDRPWTDQTGSAKARLNTSVSTPNENTVRITLAHGVNYGIWLELAKEKKYAVIAPTLKKMAPEIVEDLQGIMEKMK